MQMPSSTSASTSAWTSRAAYGAPEAPVMPRNIRTTPPLLRALGGLEESGDLAQVRFAEVRERRHRRALVHAARALEVVDLEGDALLLRALGAQIRRAELRAADAEVGVAVEAARRGEEQGAGFGLGRQLLLL